MPIAERVDASGIMKRPNGRDEFVLRRAAELALPDVQRWISSRCSYSEERILADLTRTLHRGDGLDMAQALQERGWPANARLAEILDCGMYVSEALKEMTQQWVRCLCVNLPFPIGSQIAWRGKPGVIANLRPDTAEYGISTEDLAIGQYFVCAGEDVQLAQEGL